MRLSERWYLPVFLALAGGLIVLALTGVLDALAVAVGDMPVGDAATWFTGLATTAVAVLAWRTSRDAAKVSAYALQEQVKGEASRVTWWFEPRIFSMTSEEAEIQELPPTAGSPGGPVGHALTGASRDAVLLIRNGNDSPVGGLRLSIVDEHHVDASSLGTHEIGLLRPGVARFRVHLHHARTTPDSELIVLRRLANNELAEWLEFTDGADRTWRRHADGSLQLQARD